MSELPSFPSGGPLGVLVTAATVGLLAFGVALGTELARRRRAAAAWAAAPLVLAVVTMLVGHGFPRLHGLVSFLTLGVGIRNMIAFRGASRVATGVAILAWSVALVAARMLFG